MPIYRRPAPAIAAGDAIPFSSRGEFHLFHLSSPEGTTHFPHRVRTTWQHVRSRDLVSWELLPPALLPGVEDEPDADGAWTGSVIEAGGTFHIFYTGHKLGSPTPQTICHATSEDGITFAKDPANPILLPDTARYENVDWRDPYVFWNEREQTYWMLIAARLGSGPKWRRGCIALATCTDLADWRLEPEPLYAPWTTFCPECPELFRLGDLWYLVYSRFSERAGTVYRVADDPRGPWRVPEREAFDGRRWYASKSLPKDDATRVFFGWIHDRAGETDTGVWLWGGDFAAAREVTAGEDGTLRIRLPAAIAATYATPIPASISGGRGAGPDNPKEAPGAISLEATSSVDRRFIDTGARDYLLSCRLTGFTGASSFGLLLRTDDDLAGYLVEFDRTRSTIALVRWPQPLDTFWAALVNRQDEVREVDGPRLVEHRLDLASLDAIKCQLLVSGSNIEIYVDEQVALSYRIYGSARHELGFYVEDGKIKVDEIRLLGPGK